MVKLIVLATMAAILASLGSALYFLLKDPALSPRTVKALTTRITLSLALFFFLLLAAFKGWIQPHGLRPM